jgi:hypothetical protein
MARPRRSTIDEFIDTFDSWDVETQERVMDQLELVQRLAKRRASKDKPELLEAAKGIIMDLRRIESDLGGGTLNAPSLEAAIAKAEGRT